jgi:hypothetical protein
LSIADANEKLVFQKLKNFKKSRKFLEKHGSSAHISLISLSKSDRFSKTHIYSERGIFSASSYGKNSISVFFRKIDFFEGGGAPLIRFQWLMKLVFALKFVSAFLLEKIC